MIWIVITVVALVLVFMLALARAAAQAERALRQMHRHGWGPFEETHVHVLPTPYDWQRRGDFNDDDR